MKDIAKGIVLERFVIIALMIIILGGAIWAVGYLIDKNSQCDTACQRARTVAQ